jgi:hypothetical protein
MQQQQRRPPQIPTNNQLVLFNTTSCWKNLTLPAAYLCLLLSLGVSPLTGHDKSKVK